MSTVGTIASTQSARVAESPSNPNLPPQLLVVVRKLRERIVDESEPKKTEWVVEDNLRLMFARARVENMTYEVCGFAVPLYLQFLPACSTSDVIRDCSDWMHDLASF